MERGQGGGGRRDDLFGGFGDPFGGFGGGFGRPGSLISSFLGGRDPFDDPFFTQPFGGLMGPSMLGQSMLGSSMFGQGMLGSSMFGQGMLGSSMFGGQSGLFGMPSNVGFIEQSPPANRSRGPIIKELSSDEEEEEEEEKDGEEEKVNTRKHPRSSQEPYVQEPDEAQEEKKSRLMNVRSDLNCSRSIPQGQTFTFQSSTVTYGGANGAYYTSSTTRRTGSDGTTFEESKQADTTTGKASHRISRGIQNKGHSVTRKLGSDGKVDTMQMLHNLNEDELPVFEEAWKGSAQKHLPGWNAGHDMLGTSSSRGREEQSGGWALPSTEQPQESGRMRTQSSADSFKARGLHK